MDKREVKTNGTEDSKKFDPRISTKYTADAVSPAAMEKASKITKKLGPSCKSFVWSTNWNFDGMRARPSGFTIQMDTDACVCSELVDKKKWFMGTALYKLGPEVEMSDGSLLTEEKIKTMTDSLFCFNLLNGLPDSSSLEHRLDQSYFNSENSRHDVFAPGKHPWEAALGTGSGFAGLYVEHSFNNYKWDTNFWLAVHAGAEHLSEDVHSLIEEFEGEEKTMKELLSQPLIKAHGIQASSRNRSRLLASLARSLNINLKVKELDRRAAPDISKQDSRYNFEILTPHYETITNRFEQRGIREVLLYNNTVNPSWSESIVFTHNPYAGVTILNGKSIQSANKVLKYNPWELTADAAFPVSTGRAKPLSQVKKEASEEALIRLKATAKKYARFVFTGSDFSTMYKLLDDVYRPRDASFIQKQRDMGYGAWLAPNEPLSEVQLRPVIVKLAGPSASRGG